MKNEIKKVEFPIFELIGPKCPKNDCAGVLIDNLSIKTKEFYRKCSVCEEIFDQQDAVKKLNETLEFISGMMEGAKK